MSGHNRASDLGQPQKGVDFSGRFLKFIGGAPENGLKGFGKGALAIDSQNGRLYMNTGSELSATWSEVAGSSYMSDAAGVAPIMYGEKANVLILGDSIHNWTQAYKPSDDTGFHPMIASHLRKWSPNKWSGTGVSLTTGSSVTGFKNKAAAGANLSAPGKKPGQVVGGLTEYQYKSASGGNQYTVNTANTSATYSATAALNQTGVNRLFQPFGSLFTAVNDVSPLDRLQDGLIMVGRSQSLPTQQPSGSLGTTDSTYWLNTAGQAITYKVLVYAASSGALTSVHTRCAAVDISSNFSDSNSVAIASGDYTTLVGTAPAVTDDNMDHEFGFDIISDTNTGTLLPVCFRIENPAITDGMSLAYMGSGGWKIENHASFSAANAPSAEGITNAWYDTPTLSQVLEVNDINIVMVYISNGPTSAAAEEEAIDLLNARVAAAAISVGRTPPKIVFCSSHPIANAEDGAGAARAARIAKRAAANGNSFIDLYNAARDDGKTEATVFGLGFHPITDVTHLRPTGADYYSQKIWDIITGTAS